MGDDADPSDNFGAELMATYEEGIHGTQQGYAEYMNDRLLFDLIRRLQAQYPDTFGLCTLLSAICLLFVVFAAMNAVSKAIAKEFPNKLSARQLRNM